MRMSEDINELCAALAKAQGSMKAAVFNKTNPHFRSKFADLNSCMDACKQPLAENGLCIMQLPEQINGKDMLVTMLGHSSGQWITSEYPLLASKMDSQGFGSAMTYAKRYSLCAMLGIVADEDDDGEEATDPKEKPKKVSQVENPISFITAKQAEELNVLLMQCDALDIEVIRTGLINRNMKEDFSNLTIDSFESTKNNLLNRIENRKKNYEASKQYKEEKAS